MHIFLLSTQSTFFLLVHSPEWSTRPERLLCRMAEGLPRAQHKHEVLRHGLHQQVPWEVKLHLHSKLTWKNETVQQPQNDTLCFRAFNELCNCSPFVYDIDDGNYACILLLILEWHKTLIIQKLICIVDPFCINFPF